MDFTEYLNMEKIKYSIELISGKPRNVNVVTVEICLTKISLNTRFSLIVVSDRMQNQALITAVPI